MLRAAKDAGIKLALDDFGTGFSSLGYLRRFNLDVLKIDRAFVQDVATSREDAAIVQQLVALAHALDLAPVAEGVDSAEQAQTLHGMGCEFAQGYYFSAPQPVTAIDHLLAKGTVMPDDGSPVHRLDGRVGLTPARTAYPRGHRPQRQLVGGHGRGEQVALGPVAAEDARAPRAAPRSRRRPR